MKTKTTGSKNQTGFTLIELLISMVIIAFIALGIYQSTSQSFDMRQKLEVDVDFYNSIRVALDVLRKDINQIYSPQSAALPTQLLKADAEAPPQNPYGGDSGNPLEYWAPPINSTGIRPSRLQGESTKLSFISNSHLRVYKDSRESDFAKIQYSLEEDKLSKTGEKILVKREDPAVFTEEESRSDSSDQSVRYTLLSQIKSIKFRYLDGKKDTWFDKWDTSGMAHKNIFPSVIEIELEVFLPLLKGADPKATRAAFKSSHRFRPEMPL